MQESDDCLLSELAHEFAEHLRRGTQPVNEEIIEEVIEEFVQRLPRCENEIRELFPAVAMMESLHGPTTADSADDSSTGRPLFGRRLGDYLILREMGRGGMGVVYEAVQESLSRRVALKVLPSRAGLNKHLLERFHREARACAKLHHTNIVPVFEVGEAEGIHFYAMQFIDGQPLSDFLDEAGRTPTTLPLGFTRWEAADQASSQSVDVATHLTHHGSPVVSVREGGQVDVRIGQAAGDNRQDYFRYIARLGKQAADGLAHAHREGVLHRDIKPHNLMLESTGTLWITDFGLARLADQDDFISQDDVVGTLRYLPPERFNGQVDESGDIYSLGVTLCELLTRQPVFASSQRACLVEQIRQGTPKPPRQIDAQIPRDLETIVLKAMAKDPADRYSCAELLAEDLQRFVSDRPILARRMSVWGHAWRLCRQNRLLASAIGLVMALMIVVIGVSVSDSIRIRGLLHETQRARYQSRVRLFDSLLAQAQAQWIGKRSGRQFETLRLLREACELANQLQLPVEAFDRMRTEAIAALCIADEEVDQIVDAFPVGTVLLDFDPSIRFYARGDVDGRVALFRVADNEVMHELSGSDPGFTLSPGDGVVFSPDGTHLQQRFVHAGLGTSHLRIWNVAEQKPRLAFELHADLIGRTVFSLDGKSLGMLLRSKQGLDSDEREPVVRVHVVDPSSGRNVAEPLVTCGAIGMLFHPWEPQVAVAEQSGIRILELQSGRELNRWELSEPIPLAWSPDGRQLLATTKADSRIHRWQIDSQRELPLLETGSPDPTQRIVFGPRGDRYITKQRFEFEVWSYPDGRLLQHSREGLASIRFSSDGHRLAGAHGPYPQIRILQVDHAIELRRIDLAEPNDSTSLVATISPEGKLMAAAAQNGTVLLDVQTLTELAVIPGRRTPIALLPDGNLITVGESPEGVVRWPLHFEKGTARLIVGEPSSLVEPDAWTTSTQGADIQKIWSASRDGKVIAAPGNRGSGASILLAGTASDHLERFRWSAVGPQHDVFFTSLSPDGMWVATGSLSWMANRRIAVDSVTVWEAGTGRRVVDLLVGEGIPRFSPDGKWIAVTSSSFSEGVRVWSVGDWILAPLPPAIQGAGCAQTAFDAHSQLLAVQGNQIRLLAPTTGRELAWLSVPEETSLAPQFFTPDGSHLVAFGIHTGQLYIWNLRAIRKQLADLGLDWQAPTDRP